jgi:acetolactate synthase-1/2/3 large subunit
MSSKITGANLVANTLQRLGVKYIFTLSGNHIMPIFDALLETDIKLIHVRHEAACVHMADAWGRLTGEAGIALVTGGQGHSNAVAGLFSALAAESPMVLLSGHAPRNELGRGAFQEMAQADLARPVTKASWTAESTETLPEDIERAVATAKAGRPGPVHVSLPVDLLERTVVADAPRKAEKIEPVLLAKEIAHTTLAQIKAEAKPLLICGPVFCNSHGRAMMQKASSTIGAPVIAMESPRGVNDPGLGALAEILAEADLIVLIGKPLDFTLKFGSAPTLAASCKWIVIDPDNAMIARAEKTFGERLVASAIADPAAALEQLTICSGNKTSAVSEWRRVVDDALNYLPPHWASLRSTHANYLHPVEMCEAIRAFIDAHPDATFVSDGGEIGQWAQALIHPAYRLINGVAGTIGVALPFAISAKLARPQHPVVAVMGDGTFGFHMAEFDTAVRYNIPFIAVVGNDARWNAEYQIQLRQYGAERAKNCELLPSHYERVAEALGGFGARVTTVKDLQDALERAHQSGKPACINVMIESVAAPVIRRSN